MSQTPFVVRNIRFGTSLGSPYTFDDSLWAALTDTHCKFPMTLTAEKIGEQFDIKRQQVDDFALASQKKWFKVDEAGAFKPEIAPVIIKVKGKEVQLQADEHP